MTIHIEKRTMEFDDVYVTNNKKYAKLDDVLNTLTVLLCSESNTARIGNKNVIDYLTSYKLITSQGAGCYTVEDFEKCQEMSDALSDYMDKLLNDYGEDDSENKQN